MIMCCVVKQTMFDDGTTYFVQNHSTLIGDVNLIISMLKKKKPSPSKRKENSVRECK